MLLGQSGARIVCPGKQGACHAGMTISRRQEIPASHHQTPNFVTKRNSVKKSPGPLHVHGILRAEFVTSISLGMSLRKDIWRGKVVT